MARLEELRGEFYGQKEGKVAETVGMGADAKANILLTGVEVLRGNAFGYREAHAIAVRWSKLTCVGSKYNLKGRRNL